MMAAMMAALYFILITLFASFNPILSTSFSCTQLINSTCYLINENYLSAQSLYINQYNSLILINSSIIITQSICVQAPYSFCGLSIVLNSPQSILSLNSSSSLVAANVTIISSGEVIVDASSSLSADGLSNSYSSFYSSSNGYDGGGGGFGGIGGSGCSSSAVAGQAAGSLTHLHPTAWGGLGSGNVAGGGIVYIQSIGSIFLDGVISSKGSAGSSVCSNNAECGGGAGGLIIVQSLNSSISCSLDCAANIHLIASGGSGYSGGGGGAG
jgi:hypothetical protein